MDHAQGDVERFLRSAAVFVLVGLVIYAGLYAVSESLIDRYARRNRFHMVKTAPPAEYDYVILGASHAATFDYRDMNARLEEMTGATILNLSIQGAGITVNRLVLDYFLAGHRTAGVVYVLDSFAFYSREWNEDRLQDAALYHRAPLDLTVAGLLLRDPVTRSVAVEYLSGFSKINNADRFAPDLFDEEVSRFDRSYRPVPQIDRQRISYLYPPGIDAATLGDSPHLVQFEELIRDLQTRGIRLIVVRPPIPARIYDMIPGERQFDATIESVLERYGVEYHDFSSVNNDEALFFDSDHLNQDGVLSFFENHLQDVLTGG
jgi:hypothetical protein